MQTKPLQIKQLAALAGLTPDTVRFYERQGLIPAPARHSNGYRQYTPQHLERLAFIRHCRAMDLPLEQVHALLGLLDASGSPTDHRAHAVVQQQLTRVRQHLRSLRLLEKQLQALLAHCQASASGGKELGPCGILAELVTAARGPARSV